MPTVVLVVQVGYGLKPLRDIRDRLVAIRVGKADRLPDTDLPEEVRPVIEELNDMLSYNAALLERARSQVGDLAHTLKTPLTILKGEAADLSGEQGELMRRHLGAIGENIDNYLARARVSGARVLGSRTDVGPVVAGMLESMRLLHGERGLTWTAEGVEGLVFHGDAQDFEEMLGSLLDNAGKWAAETVTVRGADMGEVLCVTVEDDGPGVPEGQRAEVLRRGKRMDETVPGSGLGLAIAADIAEFYGGELTLHTAPAGGLAARLTLPAARS